MKGLLRLCLTGLVLVTMTGCFAKKPPADADLMNGIFVLSRVDGAPFTSEMGTPELGFGDGLRVFGGFCNRFTGQGTMVKNILTVPHMASTRMLCHDEPLNELESLFGQMLAAGVELDLDGTRLTLRQGEHVLEYVRGGWGKEGQ